MVPAVLERCMAQVSVLTAENFIASRDGFRPSHDQATDHATGLLLTSHRAARRAAETPGSAPEPLKSPPVVPILGHRVVRERPSVSLNDVSNILWRERQLLELLIFKLEEEQLLLAAGRTRWLAHATREVESILDAVRTTELARAVEVDAVAADLDLEPNSSLRQLAEKAPEPWGPLFEEHRMAFLALTDEIVQLAGSNRELLARGYQSAREVLKSFGHDEADVYTPNGTVKGRSHAAVLINEAL